MKQKNIFLKSEADAWFDRNKENLSRRNFGDDNVVRAISEISKFYGNTTLKILEIGCGGGERLNYISNVINCSVSGVEPSQDAVNHCKLNNIDVVIGTADSLIYQDNTFDIVIFGFCLYLCDRDDLFRISMEADRVLKKEGWIIVHDFIAKSITQNQYHHAPELKSYKMDYKSLFTWHPDYICYQTKVVHSENQAFTDASNEWVETAVIRKKRIQ